MPPLSVDSKNRAAKAFLPGTSIQFTLPLGRKVRKGNVILTGTVVVSGGSANGTVLGEGGPINLIKRIIVTATRATSSRYPGGRIVDCTPRSLLRYAIMQRNGKFIGELAGSTLGNGAAGTYTIYLSIPIYWADDTLRNSYSTALNLDPGIYSSLQVEVRTGDLTSCFSGNDRTVNWSGLQVQWNDERVDFAGDVRGIRFQEDHVVQIAATQERMQDQALPNDGAFESWLIMQEQSAAATLSNALVQAVRVEGPNIDYEKYAQDIQQDMLDGEWIDPAQNSTGLLFIDWVDGVLSSSIPGGQLDVRYRVTNVSGANLDQLSIYTRRLVAPLAAS